MYHSSYQSMPVASPYRSYPTVLQGGVPTTAACYSPPQITTNHVVLPGSPQPSPLQPRSPCVVAAPSAGLAQAGAHPMGYQVGGPLRKTPSIVTMVPDGSSSSSAASPQSVTVGGLSIVLEGNLGKGSFGTVSKGKAHVPPLNDLKEVAVKEIKCKSAKERAQAEYEAKLMQQLTDGVDLLVSTASSGSRGVRKYTASSTRCACPSLYAFDSQTISADRSVVRIAMERVHGVPLDEFTKDASNKRGFSEAMALSRELLVQMCPTLERVSPLCVHRDVNAHNILLHAPATDTGSSNEATSSRLEVFTLIDFGLATDSKGWKDGGWKTKDIGGDCRYWPVSCWKQMLFGYKYLLANPAEAEEYMYNIDAHSLALTCLQLLSEVTSGPKPSHAVALFAAFAAYWDDAMKFHKELYAVFQGRGTWANLKKSFLQQQIADRTRRNLDMLKLALEETAKSPRSTTDEAIFCRTVKRMLSGRHVEWVELQEMLQATESPQIMAPKPAAPAPKLNRFGGSWAYPVNGGHAPGVILGNLEAAAKASNEGTATEIPMTPPRKFTHRRVRTTDNGNSMSRNVPEVSSTKHLRFGLDGATPPPGSHLMTPSPSADQAAFMNQSVAANEVEPLPLQGRPSHRRMRSAGASMQGLFAGAWAASPRADKADEESFHSMAAAGDRLRKITECYVDEVGTSFT